MEMECMDKNLEPSRSPWRQIGVISLSIQSPLKPPTANINVVYPQLSIDKVEPEAVTADTGRTHGVMVTISNTGSISVNPNVRCYVGDDEAQTTVNTANWAVEPGQTKDVPISWYHYEDGAAQLTCKFLYPDVLEPVSNLIASDAGMTSGEVSFTTAEEVEELPIILYAIIIVMVVVFAGDYCDSSNQRRLQRSIFQKKPDYPSVMESENAVESEGPLSNKKNG